MAKKSGQKGKKSLADRLADDNERLVAELNRVQAAMAQLEKARWEDRLRHESLLKAAADDVFIARRESGDLRCDLANTRERAFSTEAQLAGRERELERERKALVVLRDMAAVMATLLADAGSPAQFMVVYSQTAERMGIVPSEDLQRELKTALKRGYGAQVAAAVDASSASLADILSRMEGGLAGPMNVTELLRMFSRG